MSVEEFWQKLAENKIDVNCGMFAKGKHADMIADLANALVDAGYKTWDGSEMTDYLRTRFCTGEYKMLKRHNINRYEVCARSVPREHNEVIDVRDLMDMLAEANKPMTIEDFDSILN